MIEVVFAKAFRRHVDCPSGATKGETVGEALDAYFQEHPTVRTAHEWQEVLQKVLDSFHRRP